MTPEKITQHVWSLVIEAARSRYRKAGGDKTYEEIGKMCGVSKATAKRWIDDGEGGISTPFPNMLRYLKAFGIPFDVILPQELVGKAQEGLQADILPAATIQHMGKHSPKIVVEKGGKLVDVYAIAGAGQAWEIVEIDPIKSIDVPLSFAKQISSALWVQGESMYPTLKHGGVVGVRYNEPFVGNEIYAVRPPGEGLSVKRVLRDNEREGYILRSDNQNKSAYGDTFVPDSLAEHLFVGRVVWVWQSL